LQNELNLSHHRGETTLETSNNLANETSHSRNEGLPNKEIISKEIDFANDI
jgi:hypothetical protein